VREGVEAKEREGRVMETLEADKLGLQKENTQLKNTVDYFSKMQGQQGFDSMGSPRSFVPYSGHYSGAPEFHTEKTIPESNLYMKERELLKYQGYLESEAQKL
jgi:hypothetical protein